jgi:hypothetical protein
MAYRAFGAAEKRGKAEIERINRERKQAANASKG